MRRLLMFTLLLGIVLTAKTQNDRISYNGQDLFLNGTNLAWIDFAHDIGTPEVNFDRFGEVFKEIHDYGGNSVRLWLHTNGTATPAFDNDTVAGPGTGAIDDLKQILDSAYKYDVGLILCLWSFDMLRLSIGEPYLTRNRKILEEDAALNSYIEYALKPMVDSTKDHPGIIAWEVFNEPEGMIPTAFWGGWSDIGHVSRIDVQRVVNRVAGAIHRIKPELLVTSGVHNMHSLTAVDGGDGNFYSDAQLYSAGGDADGYLDFYQVHHYNFPLNPFKQHYEHWQLDKPLLVGEFHPGDADLGGISNYETLIDSGYAGAMGWMWLDSYGDKIKEEVEFTFHNHTAIVDIDNNLGDSPSLKLIGPESGSVFDAGSNVDFTAEADDTDGTISSVEFFLDKEAGEDSLLLTDTEAPFEYSMLNAPDGVYGVYAIATDNDGYTKKSNRVQFTIGDPPNYRYEAEEATLSGCASIATDQEASNGQYVSMQQGGCKIEWTIPNAPANATYDMVLAFAVPNGNKNNFIVVNGNTAEQIDWLFDGPGDVWQLDTIQVELTEGENTIAITDSWGWMDFDYMELPFARPEEVPDGLENRNKLERLKFYPNPASEAIVIGEVGEIDRVMIYNLQGQLVKEIFHLNGTQKIDIAHLQKGSYLIRFIENSGKQKSGVLIKE